jgi:hypothetical protein
MPLAGSLHPPDARRTRMSTAVETVRERRPDPSSPSIGSHPRKGRWIDDWAPDDPTFWNNGGSRVARRNLIFSIFSEHIGFSIWSAFYAVCFVVTWAVFLRRSSKRLAGV